MKVYNELGSGFLEKVYQEALEIEFENADIPFQKEARLEAGGQLHAGLFTMVGMVLQEAHGPVQLLAQEQPGHAVGQGEAG